MYVPLAYSDLLYFLVWMQLMIKAIYLMFCQRFSIADVDFQGSTPQIPNQIRTHPDSVCFRVALVKCLGLLLSYKVVRFGVLLRSAQVLFR